MGKKEKEHRKKVAKRSERLKQEKTAYVKEQRKFIEELIRREKESGKFDNPTTIPGLPGVDDGPQL